MTRLLAWLKLAQRCDEAGVETRTHLLFVQSAERSGVILDVNAYDPLNPPAGVSA